MTKAVFTFSECPANDDQPEVPYHFPSTHLSAVRASQGDWRVYDEPRRTSGPNSATGRQGCFATARVARIVEDTDRAGHWYAYVRDYTEFDDTVPFGDRWVAAAPRAAHRA